MKSPCPLLDHFHPPLKLQYPWECFHSNWATRLADALNDEWLPPEFLAAPKVKRRACLAEALHVSRDVIFQRWHRLKEKYLA